MLSKRFIIASILLLFCGVVISQNVSMKRGYTLPAVVVDGDTMAVVKLSKVSIFPPLKFQSHEQYLAYRRLVRDVKKVYPFAIIAKNTMIEIQLAFDTLPKNRHQNKYVKQKQEELMALYKEQLKSFSIRQGQILIKLVDREIETSSYHLIKELRGGVQATMWQGVARLFGENLKSEYDPKGEDLMIERIVMMLEQGRL